MSAKARVIAEYLSVGGNRHSAASDWSKSSNIFAFGADQNVALWRPLDEPARGVFGILTGHAAQVTAVTFSRSTRTGHQEFLLSGSADGTVKIWTNNANTSDWKCVHSLQAHEGAVNVLSVLPDSPVVISGGADMTVKVWRYDEQSLEEISKIQLKPRLIPLTIALGSLPEANSQDACFMAVGGTRNDVQIYSLDQLSTSPVTTFCATLTGHEGWIRSLALRQESDGSQVLASTSHDKYVRLWRLQPTKVDGRYNGVSETQSTLTAKIQEVGVNGSNYAITFEALLLGHEDWVYTASWNPDPNSQQLLTASADGSLTVWEADLDSGIWLSSSRLGEISGQKGATTATGSSGGFWTALWSPNGNAITCLGRTGSWRVWLRDGKSDIWQQTSGITGHVASVNGLSWSPCGGYIMSTSSDQTTRLHAQYPKKSNKRSWHEFARPQIHGYDLNCAVCVNRHQFCSGADEKLLRVFNEPKPVALMLEELAGIRRDSDSALAATAAMPVLGLSNKSIEDEANGDVDEVMPNSHEQDFVLNGPHTALQDLTAPPTEDLLSRHTLWPEHEKLYGHGYEISDCTVNRDGTLLATACKASSIDHAVIRLYETNTWNELKPPLMAHSLTVTRLAFSQDGRYLLSVGRDRQWTVFIRSPTDTLAWTQLAINPKAHSRMILDAAWLPSDSQVCFVTAGRDKTVKFWRLNPQIDGQADFEALLTITKKSAVTAVDFSRATKKDGTSILAIGEDSGTISIHSVDLDTADTIGESVIIASRLCPSRTVNRMAWQPTSEDVEDDGSERLAIASVDGSLRILCFGPD